MAGIVVDCSETIAKSVLEAAAALNGDGELADHDMDLWQWNQAMLTGL